MTSLTGKNALVTGSSSGIGLAIATAFAKEGASVMLNGLNTEGDAREAIEQVEKASGGKGKVAYKQQDIASEDGCKALVDATHGALGAVDILVNNAGAQHVAPITEFPAKKWELIINLNLSSSFYLTQMLAGDMKNKGWGRIINTASVHGLVASEGKAAYVAAKHGLLGLTKVMALDLAKDGITANAICPGYVDTPLVRGQIPDQAKTHNMSEDEVVQKVMLSEHAVKEFVQPEDIAALAIFLCSDHARAMTGGAISIDGGWLAH